MMTIYDQANEVSIWLGDDVDGTARHAMDLFSKAYMFAREETKRNIPRPGQIKDENPSWSGIETGDFLPRMIPSGLH